MKQEMSHEGSHGLANEYHVSPAHEGTISSTFMTDKYSRFHKSC